MGRWGFRRIATLCVMVWVLAACGPMLPAAPLESPTAFEATLILRTALPPTATPRAPGAATVAPASPRPTAEKTPAPAATPAYYTVREDDTLASIAAAFGVSTAALQAANGDLPADALYPGQVLLIPLDSATLLPGTLVRYLPTRTPQRLPIDPPTCYLTPAGEVLCLGWLGNIRPYPLGAATIQVSLLDAADHVLAQRMSTTSRQLIPPGERTPYLVRFQSPGDFASARAELIGASPVDSDAFAIQALEVSGATFSPEGRLIHVQGQVGGASSPLMDVLVMAILTDDADQITGYRITRPEDTLMPGDTLAIDLLITPLAGSTTQVMLYAEGSALPEE